MTNISGTNLSQCQHCGNYHTGQCPRIKAIEYYPNGRVKRVELHGAIETMLLSESVLRREWDTPKENEAWKYLQPNGQ